MGKFQDGEPLPGVEACAAEPIHFIGHIQSHGLLVALSEPDLIVEHISTNALEILGIPAEALLGASFETIVGARQFEVFQSYIFADDVMLANPIRMLIGNRSLHVDCVAHRHDGVLIVELELRQGAHSLEPLNIAAHVRVPLSHLEQASDVLELAQLAAVEVRRLSGFNRALIYRFDEEWTGEVIAESAASSPGTYLGLRFPASDIPAQARRLFLANRLRAIADVESIPIPIVPEKGALTKKPLDLTRSSLRSAAPVHIEYLRNMGVRASMTVSIVVEGRLWGMIACHHTAPHVVDRSTRAICEFIGQILASQIALRLDNVALQTRLESRRKLEEYMSATERSEPGGEAEFALSGQLCELLDADGVISRVDGVASHHGSTVEEELLLPVLEKLRKLSLRGIASSNMLSALDESAHAYVTAASGALYIGLTEGPAETGADDYVLLLRRELVETVAWAGNPDKAVNSGDAGEIHPRRSFEAWQETVRGRSRRWSELELENAGFLREQLLRQREARRLRKSEQLVRHLAQHDTLTGLVNRHSIDLALAQYVREAEADGSSFAVLFIDLDRFKHFNDTLGHAVGDEILKIVARRMQKQVRSLDVVGRLGGDEFIIIMPGLRLTTVVLAAASRILRSIEQPLGIGQDTRLHITASMGLSRYPYDGTTSEELLQRSDMAMYSAKRSGGNASRSFRDSEGD